MGVLRGEESVLAGALALMLLGTAGTAGDRPETQQQQQRFPMLRGRRLTCLQGVDAGDRDDFDGERRC